MPEGEHAETHELIIENHELSHHQHDSEYVTRAEFDACLLRLAELERAGHRHESSEEYDVEEVEEE